MKSWLKQDSWDPNVDIPEEEDGSDNDVSIEDDANNRISERGIVDGLDARICKISGEWYECALSSE